MLERSIGNEALSRSFELPEDLEARFITQFNLMQTPYPSCFSRVLTGAIRALPGFASLPATADAYIRQELREFLNEVAVIDPREFSSMTPEVFFGKKIKPNLRHLRLFLRQVFLILEKEQVHKEEMEEARSLLEKSQTENLEVTQRLNSTQEQVTAIMEKFDVISKKATKDALTGLQNRFSHDQQMLDLAKRFPDERFAFMIFDMDSFKAVNDIYGHKAGDQALQQLATLITGPETGLRYGDVSRWGGEEFVVVIPDRENRGLMVAEMVRKAVENYTFVVTDTQGLEKRLKKTISIGLARCLGEELTQEDAFKAADAALYKAKGKKFDAAGQLIENLEDKNPKNRTWDFSKNEPEPRT